MFGSVFVSTMFTKDVNVIRNHNLVLNSLNIKKRGSQLWKNPMAFTNYLSATIIRELGVVTVGIVNFIL